MHEKSLYKKNMKKDLYNIEIDIDEDIKRDIEDFYFSKNDLDNIKIPLDLEDLIEEPFEEEKQENDKLEDTIETDLFNLIDSMYKDDEESGDEE